MERKGIPPIDVVRKTQLSFTYEWEAWPNLPEYESDLLSYTKVSPEFFCGKVGLDAGCGSGRFLRRAAEYVGLEGWVVGLEVSDAIHVARKNLRDFPNAELVRGDVLHLPFRADTFDFVIIIGVLQHLSSPAKAVQDATDCLRYGGFMIATIYTHMSLADILLERFLIIARRFSLRLPLQTVHSVSKLLAAPVYLIYRVPRKILHHFSKYVRDMATAHPGNRNIGNPSFRLITHKWFDHLATPIIAWYPKEQALTWFREAGVYVVPDADWFGIIRGFKALLTIIPETNGWDGAVLRFRHQGLLEKSDC